jgi:ADP-ribosylglycohydrolase
LTGNLLGAMHGTEALPQTWLSELEMRDLIERVAVDLWAARADTAALDVSAYPLE